MRLLLLEDNELAGRVILEMACTSGYEIDWSRSKDEAEFALGREKYDVILTALGFAGQDGLDVLQRYRSQVGGASIIAMVDAHVDDGPIASLDAGADDYLIKPFDRTDLEARLGVLLEKPKQIPDQYDNVTWKLDRARRAVLADDVLVPLKYREFRLLLAFMNEPSRVFSRAELSMYVYGKQDFRTDSALNFHIRGLRRKLGDARILTIRGIGYRLSQVRI